MVFDATGDLLSSRQNINQAAVLDEIDSLGADIVRIVVPWRFVVPQPGQPEAPPSFDARDPADYVNAITAIDSIVRGAANRGMRVMLTPSSPFPDWASETGRPASRTPKPAAYEDLLVGLGRRYSGGFGGCTEGLCALDPVPPIPRVDMWSLWNEANLTVFLKPQYRNGKPYSPRLYRRLFLSGKRGLREAGHGLDTILIGETGPSGGRDAIDPIDFLRGVLCLKPGQRCAPISASGWGHHPYSFAEAPFEEPRNPGLINLHEMDRLTGALGRAFRAGATRKRLNVFVTEFGVPSVPNKVHLGVSLGAQVRHLAISEFLAWRNPRVRTFSQYLLRDDPPENEVIFTTGLRFNNGREKPAFDAFAMTLLVRRTGPRKVMIWGHVRPGFGRRNVEVRVRRKGAGERSLRTVRTDPDGYFKFGSSYRRGSRWRAIGRAAGKSLFGPLTAASKFRTP